MTRQIPRNTYVASLGILESRGFAIKSVIDVGAAEGSFFMMLKEIGLFPDTRHLFVDAMEENARVYEMAKARFGHPYTIAALSCVEGEARLKIDPNFYNTHLSTVQDEALYATERRVPLRTLDKVVQEHALEGPFLVKLDVQGAEMDVLRGGLKTLGRANIVLTEIQIFFERDNLTDLLPFMNGEGFRLFDITDCAHYPSNSLFYQCYATFIRKEHEFRRDEPWCLPEQEAMVHETLKRRRRDGLAAFERLCATKGE